MYYVLHQTHSEFWHIQHSDFFRYISAYTALLTQFHAYWDINKAYSGIFSTLCNPHVFTTLTFWALACLGPEAYLKPCETLTRHIQNPAIGHYSAIFRHIQKLLQRLCIRRNLTYSECCKIKNPSIIASRHIQNPVIITKICKYFLKYLKPDAYSERSQRFKMEFFEKIVEI